MIKEETSLIENICNDAKKLGQLTEKQKKLLLNIFGKRCENALKALEEGAVKKYVFEPSLRVVWIVVGKEKDYQVLPEANYCSCDDFYYRVIDGNTTVCYHLLAQKLSEALNKYEVITDSDLLYEVLMKDWRFIRR